PRPTTYMYTLPLHDALPIYRRWRAREPVPAPRRRKFGPRPGAGLILGRCLACSPFVVYVFCEAFDSFESVRAAAVISGRERAVRSEEHTSELQSRFDLVCRP